MWRRESALLEVLTEVKDAGDISFAPAVEPQSWLTMRPSEPVKMFVVSYRQAAGVISYRQAAGVVSYRQAAGP